MGATFWATLCASTARNLATVAGISNDKAAAAHGKPTEALQRSDPKATLAALRRMRLIDESDAEPIDAEVVEDAS